MDPILEALIEHLGAERPVQALSGAIELWGRWPVPALADAIDVLSERVGALHAPVADHTGWLDAEARGWVTDLETLVPLLHSPTRLRDRIDQLEGRGDDPRLARIYGTLVATPPSTSSRSFALWTAVFRRCERMGDPRLRRVLATRASLPAESEEAFWPRFLGKVEGLLASLPNAIEPSRAELGALRRFTEACHTAPLPSLAEIERQERAARAPSRALEPLYAAVYADPSDDGARHVLADALTEAGSPHGELIQLQMLDAPTARQTKRMRQLEKLHGRDLLGAIEPVVLPSPIAFRRGFVSSAVAYLPTPDMAALASAPEWRTLEEIWVDDPSVAMGLPVLDHLFVTSARALAEACAADPPFRVTRVTVYLDEMERNTGVPLGVAGLPHVKSLRVLGDYTIPHAFLESLLASPLFRQVEWIGIGPWAAHHTVREHPDRPRYVASSDTVDDRGTTSVEGPWPLTLDYDPRMRKIVRKLNVARKKRERLLR
ncbi:MAG: hypothetical protein R3F61_00140 [Myxococcota bacterium]